MMTDTNMHACPLSLTWCVPGTQEAGLSSWVGGAISLAGQLCSSPIQYFLSIDLEPGTVLGAETQGSYTQESEVTWGLVGCGEYE